MNKSSVVIRLQNNVVNKFDYFDMIRFGKTVRETAQVSEII